MKEIFYGYLTLLLFQLSVISKTLYAEDKPAFQSLVSISYIPVTSWKIGNPMEASPGRSPKADWWGELDYELDTNSFTIYQGEICYDSRFKLGLGVDVNDNVVGKLSSIIGYLGYKDFSVRASRGKITGTANWIGDQVPGQPQKAKVDTKYMSTDLLYSFDSLLLIDYIGISYTEYTIPVPLEAGFCHAYDDNTNFKTYSFIFGVDTVNSAAMNARYGLRLWVAMDMGIGYGRLKISDEGMRRMRESLLLYSSLSSSRYSLKDKQKYSLNNIQGDATLGLFYLMDLDYTTIGIGVGYNFSGRWAMAVGSGVGGEESINTEHYMYHHGVVFKVITTL